MDIEKYIAGKVSGVSKVELHGDATLLVTWPSGFDPDTGAALPPKEQGLQAADILAMKKAAEDGVLAAQEALAKAQARVAAFNTLVADAVAVLPPKAPAEAEALPG